MKTVSFQMNSMRKVNIMNLPEINSYIKITKLTPMGLNHDGTTFHMTSPTGRHVNDINKCYMKIVSHLETGWGDNLKVLFFDIETGEELYKGEFFAVGTKHFVYEPYIRIDNSKINILEIDEDALIPENLYN